MPPKLAPSKTFRTGDLVWAKMKGYSNWPSRIVEPMGASFDPRLKPPREARLAPHLLCFFFGSKNYAWVEEAKISDYDSNRYKLRPARLTHNLKEAIEAIEAALTRAKQEKGNAKSENEPRLSLDEAPGRSSLLLTFVNSVSVKDTSKRANLGTESEKDESSILKNAAQKLLQVKKKTTKLSETSLGTKSTSTEYLFCKFCDKPFHKRQLKRHVANWHDEIGKMFPGIETNCDETEKQQKTGRIISQVCLDCGAEVKGGNMKRHIECHHSQTKSHICNHCSKAFNCKEYLTKHKKRCEPAKRLNDAQ